ncbi:phosphoribosyltransferase family protein [Persephonella sp.]|uniref:phosphoribosyltransferase family protein n=1 Tax=Persephonella sp. TaxID=2060922 RepID=UPI0025CFC23F|nr:phosphoribosyltransferase family protein [Persephonella sp.]
MGKLIYDENLKNKVYIFEDREEAGERLAEFIKDFIDKNSIILAVPSGGVPVGKKLSKKLKIPFDLILVKNNIPMEYRSRIWCCKYRRRLHS